MLYITKISGFRFPPCDFPWVPSTSSSSGVAVASAVRLWIGIRISNWGLGISGAFSNFFFNLRVFLLIWLNKFFLFFYKENNVFFKKKKIKYKKIGNECIFFENIVFLASKSVFSKYLNLLINI